jgi:hypothetical protein
MNRVRTLLFFHKRFIIPALVLTSLTGAYSWASSDSFSVQSFGLGYLVTPLLLQLIVFEYSYKGEYYFYFNLGISRKDLWISNFILSLLGAILISLITWSLYTLIVS